ncbi:MAG: hypothetical protein ACXADC_16640 [Candidatus Thorarchaeota archaeon]|jgi:hypothetical protein
MNTDEEFLDEEQKRFLKRHWKMAIVFAVVFAIAVAAALLVFLWVVADAQATALVPSVLGQFSIGSLITLILHVVFWELVLVVSWVVVIAAAVYFMWYKQLPEEEQDITRGDRGRREEGDAFGFLVAVFWLIITWIDGRWDLAFESWTLNDWVYSWIAALLWVFLIFGIPIAVYFFYWIGKEMKGEPEAVRIVDEPSEEPTDSTE